MSSILFVTWDGGGNVPPALGIASRLQRDGVTVRFLGHEQQRALIAGAGFAFVPFRHAHAWSAVDQEPGLPEYVELFTDPGPGRDVLEQQERDPADLVVIDCLLLGALDAADRAGIPYIVLVHTFYEFLTRAIAPGPIGHAAAAKRMSPARVWRNASAVIVAADEKLDSAARHPLPSNARYTGPAWQQESISESVRAASGSTPRILVSLSTIYWDVQLGVLQRVLDAVGSLDVHAIVTTGPSVDPAQLRAPDNVELHRYLPHAQVMPTVSLVVGHGGHSTAMLALAHGLPLVMIPLFELVDQPIVAGAIQDAGAGIALAGQASTEEILAAIDRVLKGAEYRSAAVRIGRRIRERDGSQAAADLIVAQLAPVLA
jgi:UDP:flavonoid glycosyltransferase YjiC (YdhE family)